jgi:hypothetical protein
MEFVGGAPQAAEPADGFECAEMVQGGGYHGI